MTAACTSASCSDPIFIAFAPYKLDPNGIYGAQCDKHERVLVIPNFDAYLCDRERDPGDEDSADSSHIAATTAWFFGNEPLPDEVVVDFPCQCGGRS